MAMVAGLVLAGCAIEVGPPPESDPPLVPESAKVQPPKQPTEPQAWSRDLDFEAGPTKIARGELAEGLVATDTEVTYSEQHLTYQSAFDEGQQMTAAERTLKRARERAAAAGLPPPPAIAPPPIEPVSAQALPPLGTETASTATPRRESRLPPPPKFPPLPAKTAAAEPGQVAEAPPPAPVASPG
ncbi:MAG: hypothetical protein ACFB13_09020, partial [Kiloniellaceae bacterium]